MWASISGFRVLVSSIKLTFKITHLLCVSFHVYVCLCVQMFPYYKDTDPVALDQALLQ